MRRSLHNMLIGQFGMALGELWWLSDPAADCAADGVYETERLGQVVVGAQPEAVYPVGRELPANLVAVRSGQVPVQYHDVVAGDGQMAERIAAVKDDVHGHALPAQPRSDRPGQNPVIFHNQHSHASNDAS